jgi:hypothetical protein
LAACEAAADLCLAGDLTPSGPVECVPQLETRTPSYCEVQQTCTQELEGDSGATLSTTHGVFCQDDGVGRLLCNCANQPYQYYAADRDGTTACDAVFDYCDDPVTPVFGDSEDCRPLRQSGSPGYCELQNSCLRTSEIADGISVVQSDYVYTGCAASTEGGAFCNCQNSAGNFNIVQEAPVSGLTSCTEALAICRKIPGIEADGEPVCTNTSQSAQGNYCNASIDCAASATVDGSTISLHGYLAVNCSGDSSGWTCSCSSGSEYASTTVDAETAWDACTNGSKACEDAVEIQFGNRGGFGGYGGFPMPVPGTGGTFF